MVNGLSLIEIDTYKGKNMKKIAFVALLSAFVATPAMADNTGKFYVAGDLGSASYSNVDVTGSVTGTFPNPGVVRIAGGYHFSPMLAAEVGYSKFGDSVLNGGIGSMTLSAHSFQVAAVGSYPLSDQFDLIGKLGLANNSSDVVGSGSIIVTNGSSSQTDLLIGLGAQYHINSQYSVRAQYESFGKFQNSSNTNPMKASAISVGLAYNF